MSQQIQEISHRAPDIVVIGDYCITVASHFDAERCSFEKIDAYLKEQFGITDGTQSAISFVQSFYNVPERSIMTQSHWRLFLIALVCYILGRCKTKMTVYFLNNATFDIWKPDGWYYKTDIKRLYGSMYKQMWQKKPTVLEVAGLDPGFEWCMSNEQGRPVEIDAKLSEDVQIKYNSPLKLTIKKPEFRLNFS